MIERPAWFMALTDALNAPGSTPESRFAQLATIDVHGRPSNRTLVFRRFVGGDPRLVFTTDARSGKASELAVSPWAELCWWFPAVREQFRIRGRAFLTDGGNSADLAQARLESWNELREEAKRSFTWPTPGESLADPSAFVAPAPETIPAHFALLVLVPERIDHLQLKPGPHIREIHSREGTGACWISKRVNP